MALCSGTRGEYQHLYTGGNNVWHTGIGIGYATDRAQIKSCYFHQHQASLIINDRKGAMVGGGVTIMSPCVSINHSATRHNISISDLHTRHQCHQPRIVAIKHRRLQIQISTIYNIYISIIVSTKGSLARPITVSLFIDIHNLDSA